MKDFNIAERIYTKKYIDKIKSKFLLLGVYNKINANSFIIVRLILCIAVFTSLLLFSSLSYIYSPVITLILYWSIEYIILDIRIRKRAAKLDYEALFFFEVLTLSLETGKNLKGALDLTSNTIDSELSTEFKNALKEMKFGKTLTEVLNDLKKRIPSDAINNVILNIVQSNIFGSSIIDTLYNQVEFLRDRKILEVKAIINKMPVKMSIISVLFFIPIILLLILAPIILNLL